VVRFFGAHTTRVSTLQNLISINDGRPKLGSIYASSLENDPKQHSWQELILNIIYRGFFTYPGHIFMKLWREAMARLGLSSTLKEVRIVGTKS
jgi:hypothetical protein